MTRPLRRPQNHGKHERLPRCEGHSRRHLADFDGLLLSAPAVYGTRRLRPQPLLGTSGRSRRRMRGLPGRIAKEFATSPRRALADLPLRHRPRLGRSKRNSRAGRRPGVGDVALLAFHHLDVRSAARRYHVRKADVKPDSETPKAASPHRRDKADRDRVRSPLHTAAAASHPTS